MKALWIVAFLATVISVGEAVAQQPGGSQLSQDENTCATCHGESDLWGGENLRFFVPLAELAEDVHWKNGVNCHDCHGGDPSTFNVGQAHARQADGAQSSVQPFLPSLSERIRSPARLETQVAVCHRCHEPAADAYMASVHGHGLQESGLVVTAVCTDCHGGHGIYPAIDPRSTLYSANVAATCAKCHQFIQERVQQSVHGRTTAPQEAADGPTGEDGAIRLPSCVDCHEGHDRPHPRSAAFRLGLPDRCGHCHAALTSSYSQSVHGELTELGYLPAAKCSDCHGSHDILPISEPASQLSPMNRRQTCAKCHIDATDNFLDFDPHADPRDAGRDPTLYWVNFGLTGILIGVFSLFGLHSILWFVRSLIHVIKQGRPKRLTPGDLAYLRFKPLHRVFHTVLMVSFLGLALTGLPLKYSQHEWAQTLSQGLGGFESTGLWHRIFGAANIGCLLFYVLWFSFRLILAPRKGRERLRYMFGPDSPLPNRRDLQDVGRMLRWFIGLGPKPTFERWAYWEKFDLWGASTDIILIGTTGIILWFPNQVCSLLPGQVLNIADLIHSKLALLATGFVFAIHFFSTHLLPEKFPMDMSVLTGLVSKEAMDEERPELVQRLSESGQLERFLVRAPSRRTLSLRMLGGLVAIAIGLALLFGIVTAVF